MLRAYRDGENVAQRVAVESNGDVLRHVPAALARAMVDGGSATIANANGRVKSARLVESAATHATGSVSRRTGTSGSGSASARSSTAEASPGSITRERRIRSRNERLFSGWLVLLLLGRNDIQSKNPQVPPVVISLSPRPSVSRKRLSIASKMRGDSCLILSIWSTSLSNSS